MNTYHISYVAFGNTGKDDKHYIRGRRFTPNSKGLGGTDLEPDYWSEGLFKTGFKHHITIIKQARDLYMKVGIPNRPINARCGTRIPRQSQREGLVCVTCLPVRPAI